MQWTTMKLAIFLLICPIFVVYSKGKKKAVEQERRRFQALVDEMWAMDNERPVDYKLNWGRKCCGLEGVSAKPLFSYVNEDIFRHQQYTALIALYQADVFQTDVCHEDMNAEKEQLMLNVFDAFTNTSVFRIAFRYLQEKGKALDWDSYYRQLFYFWFEPYSRCKGIRGTSGFEHVFLGEWRRTKVSGLHNWVRYYFLEKSGAITYHGYIDHIKDFSGTIQFSWENRLKDIGGFNIATSPAFDFSIFTVCALMHPGPRACKFNLNGHDMVVTTQTLNCDIGNCLATAYPNAVKKNTKIEPNLLFVILIIVIIVVWF